MNALSGASLSKRRARHTHARSKRSASRLDARGHRAGPAEAVGGIFAHVHHERGAKARQARAARTPDAPVDNPERARLQQTLRQSLRLHVAVRIQNVEIGAIRSPGLPRAAGPQVVKFGAEISEVIVERHVVFETPDFSELDVLVEHDLGLRSPKLERRIPRASLGTVES